MSTETSPAEKSPQALDGHHLVDESFASALEERFGIPAPFILRALEGEPHQPAVALCRLATRYEERNGTLLMLALKYGRGRARRQRTVGTPPHEHRRGSPRRSVDRSGPGRGQDIVTPRGVAPGPRRGVMADPDEPEALVERVGV